MWQHSYLKASSYSVLWLCVSSMTGPKRRLMNSSVPTRCSSSGEMCAKKYNENPQSVPSPMCDSFNNVIPSRSAIQINMNRDNAQTMIGYRGRYKENKLYKEQPRSFEHFPKFYSPR